MTTVSSDRVLGEAKLRKLRSQFQTGILMESVEKQEVWTNVSFLKGMTEFRVGEVFLICRKIILIHGQGPGFCYFEDNRFK